jgi:hypothetical protein
MEMQGRFEDGAAWLRQHQPQWAEGNGFAAHLWWHKSLFRLEALDFQPACCAWWTATSAATR